MKYCYPTVYKLQDQAAEDTKGTFYGTSEELQKVTEPESYSIEKVVQKKKKSSWKYPLFCKVERFSG